MTAAPAHSTSMGHAASPLRVMVVDDSAVARGFVRRWLEREPGIEIVASLRSAREAIAQLERARPDVLVLDIEMPDMDGITALPLLLKEQPGLAVIVASTLTRRNAEVTLRALALGALDCIQKPDARGAVSSDGFRRALITGIRTLGPFARRRTGSLRAFRPRSDSDRANYPFPLRRPSGVRPDAVVVGASTGGPQALSELCGQLGRVIDQVPVLIAQHMPPTFTAILAEHLGRASGRSVSEAMDGEPVRAGRLLIAPGHCHLRVERTAGGVVARLDASPPVRFSRPSVDILFSSAATVWGERLLGLMLTGMGTDGLAGGADIVASGGDLIAQDEATSVVWGMPRAVAQAGLCTRVLPLALIAPALSRIVGDAA